MSRKAMVALGALVFAGGAVLGAAGSYGLLWLASGPKKAKPQ